MSELTAKQRREKRLVIEDKIAKALSYIALALTTPCVGYVVWFMLSGINS